MVVEQRRGRQFLPTQVNNFMRIAEDRSRSMVMSISTLFKYLVAVPKGVGKIIGISCLVPCVTKALGTDRVREMVLNRQDPDLPQRSRERLLSSIEGTLDFANTKEKSKAIWEGTMREVNMLAELGGKAPNPVMMRLEGRSQCHLLDEAKPGRPLIINFGSCT
ncbi:thyroxine 5-deiodinase-like isoform X2 [Homarus americanus]|uniref:thyroxine 5-deiodinase-like isoform X2 n=1 Tax=Homarus americanus TaxID=6706 RepID=UPI001C452713|nr:thyroxine 5-deiodinase-like isoform X2 [Homarus americanus]